MSRATWVIPAALFAVAAALYVLLGSLQDVPLVAPDEFLYGELSRSVADGDGLALYGTPQDWPTALYIYLLAPAWLGDSLTSGYDTAKVIGSIAACTVVVPVWMLARRYVAPLPALVAVVLTLTGTWMVATAGLLTENLAFPLSTACLAAAVFALREPQGRWGWIALGFAALATLARAQMGVLFAILLAALLLDALRADDRRAAISARRIEIGVLGAIVLGGLAVVLSGSEAGLGVYTDVADFRPGLGDVLGAVGKQWLALVTVTAFLPAAVLGVLAARRASWADDELAPLLCVTLAAVVLLVLESGLFIAGPKGLDWSIERYVMYAAPPLFVLTVLAFDRGLLSVRELAIAGAAIVLPLLATPAIRLALEERAQFGTWTHLDGLGLGAGPAIALVAALVVGGGVLLVARARPTAAALGAGGVLLVVLLVQSQAIWNWHVDYADTFRSQYPDDLSWVDNQAGGPATRILVFASSPLFQVADFFNEDVGDVLAPGADPSRPKGSGRVCFYNADARGALKVSPGCKVERHLWNDDPLAVLSFHDGRTVARDRNLGQIIEVPAQPRLQSIIRLPCQRQTLRGGLDGSSPVIPQSGPCGPTMAVDVWADRGGVVELTFQGGSRAQELENDTRTWELPPGRPTRVRVPVPKGQSTNGFDVDWVQSLGAPRLTGAALISGGTRTPLL